MPAVHGLKQLDILVLTWQVEGNSLAGDLWQESDAVIPKTGISVPYLAIAQGNSVSIEQVWSVQRGVNVTRYSVIFS